MSIEDSWASLDVIFIVFGSKDYLVAAAVLYLYPARHTQAAPVFINCFKDHSASREVQPVSS